MLWGRTMNTFRLALCVIFAVALGACRPPPPVMKLHSARVVAPWPDGVHMALTMSVRNDYPIDIQVRNVRTAVVIGRGYQLPPIVHSPNQWLRAGSTTAVEVPVVIPWHLVTPLLGTSVGSHMIPYHVSGFADVTATSMLKIDRDDFTINEKGAVSRGELVMAAGRGVFQ
jgi:hypothetical protein